MATRMRPFLMFEGRAEEAMNFYLSLFPGSEVYMPVDAYGFSRLFTWVGDRFGVTWQLNLP